MDSKDTDLIFRFLENELNGEELKEFSHKFKTDPSFAEEVTLYSRILISLRSASKTSTKILTGKPHLLRFMSHHRKGSTSLVRSFRSVPMIYKIAVAIIPLLAAGIIFLLLKKSPSTPDQLYADFYKKPVKEEAGRGLPRGIPFDPEAFLHTLESDNFRQIDSIPSLDGLFYFALNCMEQYRFNEAIYAFNLLMDNRDQTYNEDAEWYLGLCYLRCGRINDAIVAFSMIADTADHPYREQALAILGQLR